MRLQDLLQKAWDRLKPNSPQAYTIHATSTEAIEIDLLTDDSRKAQDKTLFFAIKGTHSDGHQYIDKALDLGAKAVVLEDLPNILRPEVCYIQVSDSQEAMGLIASAFYGHPSRDMRVVGVTGTNGKTTIATLLYRLHRAAGYPTGLLSTVCNYIDARAVASTHTTPGAIQLQALLAEMRDAGCAYAFMEVSSHAVAQRRIAGIDFDGGVFTNLTRDHLDYHGTVLEYLNAKKRFFDDLPSSAFALTNADEKSGAVMLQNTKARKLNYALHSLADYKAQILTQHADCTDLEIDGQEVTIRLVGDFNVYNALAVYATSIQLGMERGEVLRLLSTLKSVDGRLETFRSERHGYTAFVDYAHTPDALVNVLLTIQTLRSNTRGGEQAKIITVVGCGGDRDRGKRPIMAAESARLSDRVILTSDNPRTEKPEDILEEMKAGLDNEALTRTLVIVDRAEAIRTACMLAGKGDYILIAGKGHEDYQEINGVKHHFDDREVVSAIINN